jgi:hypothetical protein
VGRRGDQRGVVLVAAHDPGARVLGGLAELDVALDEPLHPQLLVGLDVPRLVEQGFDRRPALVLQQQVVAFGDDQRDAFGTAIAPAIGSSISRRNSGA